MYIAIRANISGAFSSQLAKNPFLKSISYVRSTYETETETPKFIELINWTNL